DLGFSTQLESGGLIVPSITTDIDPDSRYPNPGYPENPLFPATAPDIGADEFAGMPLDLTPPTIGYTPLTNTTSITNRALSNVIIFDPSGINVTLGTRPRLYFKKTINNNTYVDNTSATNGWKYVQASGSSSPFDFTLNYALLYPGGGVSVGDSIQYFVVAQD